VSAWAIERCTGLDVVICSALSELPGVGHAFSTRSTPEGATFDLGSAEDTGPDVERRRRALSRAAGLGDAAPVVLRQVHGVRIVDAAQARDANRPEEADGLLAAREMTSATVASVRVADCVPILLADRGGEVIAAVHAGWRGTAACIVEAAVAGILRLGRRPSEIVAALGPAIGGCCYRVGPGVAGKVAAGCGVGTTTIAAPAADEHWLLDLRRANRIQLERAGLAPAAIHAAPWCTHCDSSLFFSYRREGSAAGRAMAVIGWTRTEGRSP
jgi:YfiH family protein